jgi:hypothetical protein
LPAFAHKIVDVLYIMGVAAVALHVKHFDNLLDADTGAVVARGLKDFDSFHGANASPPPWKSFSPPALRGWPPTASATGGLDDGRSRRRAV